MADLVVALPEPHPEDDEDVVWGLSTASALWARGERRDAIEERDRVGRHQEVGQDVGIVGRQPAPGERGEALVEEAFGTEHAVDELGGERGVSRIEGHVVEQLGRVLRLDPSRIDRRAPFEPRSGLAHEHGAAQPP